MLEQKKPEAIELMNLSSSTTARYLTIAGNQITIPRVDFNAFVICIVKEYFTY